MTLDPKIALRLQFLVYVEDPVVLHSALQSGHDFVPVLAAASEHMCAEIMRRGWA